jgi:hypothetical protein
MEVRIYCHILSWRMKPGSAILNSRQWIGTVIQLHGSRNSRVPSAGKVVVIVFWNEKNVTVAKFLVKRTSVNSKCHIEVLRSLNARLHPFYPMRKVLVMFLLHENCRLYTSV